MATYRTTRTDLNCCVDILNNLVKKQGGTPDFAIGSAIGGVKLTRGLGVVTISSGGFVSKKELWVWIAAYMSGLTLGININ